VVSRSVQRAPDHDAVADFHQLILIPAETEPKRKGGSIMTINPGRQRLQRSFALRERFAMLRATWTTYMLKRAIAEVDSMSERDYRDFGFDKSEILDGLRQLRDNIEFCSLRAAQELSIVLFRHEARLQSRAVVSPAEVGADRPRPLWQ
jgi:hypothetical protein